MVRLFVIDCLLLVKRDRVRRLCSASIWPVVCPLRDAAARLMGTLLMHSCSQKVGIVALQRRSIQHVVCSPALEYREGRETGCVRLVRPLLMTLHEKPLSWNITVRGTSPSINGSIPIRCVPVFIQGCEPVPVCKEKKRYRRRVRPTVGVCDVQTFVYGASQPGRLLSFKMH